MKRNLRNCHPLSSCHCTIVHRSMNGFTNPNKDKPPITFGLNYFPFLSFSFGKCDSDGREGESSQLNDKNHCCEKLSSHFTAGWWYHMIQQIWLKGTFVVMLNRQTNMNRELNNERWNKVADDKELIVFKWCKWFEKVFPSWTTWL